MKNMRAHMAQMAVVALCSTVLFCGCAKNSDVVIKINDQDITRGQYYKDFNEIKNARFKDASKEIKSDSSFAVLSLKQKYTDDIILKTLLEQEFAKREIKASEEEIQAKKQEIMSQFGSEEQFKDTLKQNNVSDERFRSDMEMEVRIDKLVNQLAIKDASEGEAKDFYNKNKQMFMMPERVKVSHILFDTNPETIKRNIAEADKSVSLSSADINKKVQDEIARKETVINEVLAKVKANPKDFAKFAQQYSEDPGSAQNGGDLGYITKDSVVREFGDAAFSQKIGVVGPVVETQFGKHIIIVRDKAKAGPQSFEQVKNDLMTYMTRQKKSEGVRKFFEDIKNKAKIEYVDETLKPENIEKQLDEALKKQIEQQQKMSESKAKKK